jgi:DNA recombination protein RmuC
MILEGVLGAALIVLGWMYQRLQVRCAIAEERVKHQSEMQESIVSLSAEAFEKAHDGLQSRAKEELFEKKEAIEKALHKLELQMRALEQERKTDYGMIRQQIQSLLEAETQLKSETANLSKALRSPTTRGRWGEIQLRRIVELAGMIHHCDFFEQNTDTGCDTRLRPDLLVRLPGGRQVVVDAKVPLNAYLEAIGEIEEGVRILKLKEHARQVRIHIQSLSKKSYWEHFQPTPEFVILFLPSEAIFGAALEQEPSLLELGAEQSVIIATPTTLIALLRAVSYGWKQESVSRFAEQVSLLGHDLYKRIVDMQQHWNRAGKALSTAVEAYNKATGSLETRVMVTARKFQEMGAASTNLELPDTLVVENEVRELRMAEESPPSGE